MNTQDCPQAPGAHDLDLLNASLELAVAQCEDLAPAVFARFFARCPAAKDLFSVPDAAMPPLGCGQMVFEIISLLLDSAAGKPYVAPYMHQIATEHAGFRVQDGALYSEFMAALMDVFADLLGPQWTSDCAQAWARQSARLLESLPASSHTH
jgi:hemoglobin-like flavoprotein